MGDDATYFRQRAMIERHRAIVASRVAALHLALADQYQAKVDLIDRASSVDPLKPKLVWSKGDEIFGVKASTKWRR